MYSQVLILYRSISRESGWTGWVNSSSRPPATERTALKSKDDGWSLAVSLYKGIFSPTGQLPPIRHTVPMRIPVSGAVIMRLTAAMPMPWENRNTAPLSSPATLPRDTRTRPRLFTSPISQSPANHPLPIRTGWLGEDRTSPWGSQATGLSYGRLSAKLGGWTAFTDPSGFRSGELWRWP